MMNFILFDVWGVEKIIIYTYIYIYVYKPFYIIDIFYLIKNTTFDLKRWALEGGASIYIYICMIIYLCFEHRVNICLIFEDTIARRCVSMDKKSCHKDNATRQSQFKPSLSSLAFDLVSGWAKDSGKWFRGPSD